MNVGDRVTITRNGVPVFRAVVERVVPMNGRAQLHQIEHCDGRPVKSTGRYRDVATLRLHVLLRSGRVVDLDAGYGGEMKAEVDKWDH